MDKPENMFVSDTWTTTDVTHVQLKNEVNGHDIEIMKTSMFRKELSLIVHHPSLFNSTDDAMKNVTRIVRQAYTIDED